MSAYLAKSLRFERREVIRCEPGTGITTVVDVLVPVHSTSTQQPDGSMKCVRVTEVQFPLTPTAPYWAEVPEPEQSNLVTHLMLTCVRSDVSGTVQPMLQAGCSAPAMDEFLALDQVALDVHAADVANSFAGCDNPWVADLFAQDEDEELEDVG